MVMAINECPKPIDSFPSIPCLCLNNIKHLVLNLPPLAIKEKFVIQILQIAGNLIVHYFMCL